MKARLEEAKAALDQARADRVEAPPSLFDPPVEVSTVDRGYLRSVEENASDQWNAHALAAVRSAAMRHDELTVDDVWPFITEEVHDSRALGPVMLRASKAGIIDRVRGAFRTSDRPETHARPLALWRSLIQDAD
jgi:hypothetical protein